MHKASHLYTRRRAQSQDTKPNAQSKEEVTILGDHKYYKLKISQYKTLTDRFCNDSSNLWENKDFRNEAL